MAPPCGSTPGPSSCCSAPSKRLLDDAHLYGSTVTRDERIPLEQRATSGDSGGAPDLGARRGEAEDGWAEWLKRYAEGKWKGDSIPQCPPAVQHLHQHHSEAPTSPPPSPPPLQRCQPPPPPSLSTESLPPIGLFQDDLDEVRIFAMTPQCCPTPSSGASTISPEGHLEFYRQHRFFPAPKGPWNAERLQLQRRLGLDRPTRRAAVDRVCRVAKLHWKTKMVLISLVFDDCQTLAAETGWDPVDPGLETPPRQLELSSALGPHGMALLDPAATFIIPDASKDWRFANNPYTLANGGPLAFYASANIYLPTSVLHSSPPTAQEPAIPRMLPVGSLCIVDDQPRASAADFGADDRQLLHDLADMIAREFQLGFEQIRRNTEGRQLEYLGSFLSSYLVYPSPDEVSAQRRPPTPPTPRHGAPATAQVPPDDASHSSKAFNDTARQLRKLTGAHSAAILDLRSFRAPMARRTRDAHSGGKAWDVRWGNAFADNRLAEGSIFLMGKDGEGDWEAALAEKGFNAVISASLLSYHANGGFTAENPLSKILPPGTSTSCAVPLDDVDGTPGLLLILTSTDKYFQFEPNDRRWVRHIGAVIMGSLLRQRALEADRAKLAFVSQVSHELRTPLHGVNSQLELIREFSSPHQLAKLRPLLDTADVCLESLRDVLDDTLDFAKLSNTSPSETQKRPLVVTDLARLVEDILKTTWVRRQRVDLVSGDGQGGIPGSLEKVDVILEVEKRDTPWTAFLDVGGMKRVLLNICGNALKFTQRGHVKVRLQELPVDVTGDMTPTGQRLIGIDIEDTGCGMSPDFLRDGKLWQAFVQEDSFSNGAGLGMSICAKIVKRFGGKMDVLSNLGKGTTIRITLPLNFVTPTPPVTSPPREPSSFFFGVPSDSQPSTVVFSRRVISDELGTLLATPGSEKGSFEFGVAIQDNTSPETLELSLPPMRAMNQAKLPTRSVLGEQNESPDFALEIAKLSMATGLTLPPRPGVPFPEGSERGLESPESPTENAQRTSMGDSQKTPTARTPNAARPKGDWLGDVTPVKSLAPGVRILAADDNPVARNILSQLLKGKGIAFELASDGQEAVDKFTTSSAGNSPFSLLILDHQMPFLSGLDAAHRIRAFEQEAGLNRCRIVILSGLTNDVVNAASLDGRQGERGPVDSFITKGGKSLKAVLDEAKMVQALLDDV